MICENLCICYVPYMGLFSHLNVTCSKKWHLLKIVKWINLVRMLLTSSSVSCGVVQTYKGLGTMIWCQRRTNWIGICCMFIIHLEEGYPVQQLISHFFFEMQRFSLTNKRYTFIDKIVYNMCIINLLTFSVIGPKK